MTAKKNPAAHPGYSVAAIRSLLKAAFDAGELERFCQDRPFLRPAVDRWGPKAGLEDRVDELINYCEKKALFPRLLSEVEQENPEQYARFTSRLYQAQPSAVESQAGRSLRREPLSRQETKAPRIRRRKDDRGRQAHDHIRVTVGGKSSNVAAGKNILQLILNLDLGGALASLGHLLSSALRGALRHRYILVSLLLLLGALFLALMRLFEASLTPPYASRFGDVNLSPDELELLARSHFWLSPAMSCLLWLSLLLVLLLTTWALYRRAVGCIHGAVVCAAVLFVIATSFLLPTVARWGEQHSLAKQYYSALTAFLDERYADASQSFARIYNADPSGPVGDEALGYLGGALYFDGQTKEALETYARILVERPQSSNREAIVHSLHWAIYRLGKESGSLQQAEPYLTDLRSRFPTEELGIYWLAISPELYDAATELPFANLRVGCFESLDPDCEDRMSSDLQVLAQLVRSHPQERYYDLALFLLGEDELMTRTVDQGLFLDYGYYRLGDKAYAANEFEQAVEAYKAFMDRFPGHRWSDDAAYNIGLAYQDLGQYEQALDYYLMTYSLPDGDAIYQARDGVLSVFDFGLDADEIRDLLPAFLSTPFAEITEYSLAEALMEEDRFVEAREQFEAVKTRYPSGETARYCDYNLVLAEQLIEASSSLDALLGLARYLLQPEPQERLLKDFQDIVTIGGEEPEIRIYYNELWRGGRRGRIAKYQDEGISLYLQHNDNARAATTLLQFLESSPPESQKVEALFLLGDAYKRLSYLGSFLPYEGAAVFNGNDLRLIENFEEGFRFNYRSLAHQYFADVVDQYPATDWAPRAQAEIASLYLVPPWDFERARVEFRTLIRRWPDHSLANNSLAWIARTYLWDARKSPIDSPACVANYEAAIDAYQELIQRYPTGHVGAEAQEELQIAQDELDEKKAWQQGH